MALQASAGERTTQWCFEKSCSGESGFGNEPREIRIYLKDQLRARVRANSQTTTQGLEADRSVCCDWEKWKDGPKNIILRDDQE